MADAKHYITSGLPIAKDSGQSPTAGGSSFVTSGLPKVVEGAVADDGAWYYYAQEQAVS